MKLIAATTAIILLGTTAAHASVQADAKRELEGWGRAAAAYEMTCNAGKLREQMPKEKAVKAYDCFAEIIKEEVDLQYPELYATLSAKMKEAHEDYGTGKSDWEATLNKLQDASDEYNTAVAKRNKTASSSND